MTEALVRLGDLCEFVGVQVDPTSRADDVYVGLEHVASGRFERSGQGKASDVQSSKYTFKPGDVLYGKLRPYLDKAVLAGDAGICTTELLVLRVTAMFRPTEALLDSTLQGRIGRGTSEPIYRTLMAPAGPLP
jgi:hypothetical protein